MLVAWFGAPEEEESSEEATADEAATPDAVKDPART
jgi:hypothetical protein